MAPADLHFPDPDPDCLFTLIEAVEHLARARGLTGPLDPHDRPDPADIVHLLASLLLQAQLWLPLAIHDALQHGTTIDQIAELLLLPHPDPITWHNLD